MTMRFQNKVAIVTGAGNGIGRAIALRLSKEGDRVAALDLNRENVEKTVETIRSTGGIAVVLTADITRYSDVKAAAVRKPD